jgi:hypothetical protein
MPDETLTDNFEAVRLIAGPSTLMASTLFCSKWRAVALPVLYRDVQYSDSRLASFAPFFPRAHACPLVRSLALVIGLERIFTTPPAARPASADNATTISAGAALPPSSPLTAACRSSSISRCA